MHVSNSCTSAFTAVFNAKCFSYHTVTFLMQWQLTDKLIQQTKTDNDWNWLQKKAGQ